MCISLWPTVGPGGSLCDDLDQSKFYAVPHLQIGLLLAVDLDALKRQGMALRGCDHLFYNILTTHFSQDICQF